MYVQNANIILYHEQIVKKLTFNCYKPVKYLDWLFMPQLLKTNLFL